MKTCRVRPGNTQPTKEALIELGAAEFEGATAYLVRDNGIGFAMAEPDKRTDGVGIGPDTVKKSFIAIEGVWAK